MNQELPFNQPGQAIKRAGTASSMRRIILIGLGFALVFILGVSGIVSYHVALHEADEIFSARLATSARVLESLLAKQVSHATVNRPIVIALPPELSASQSDDALPTGHPYETKLAFQVWSSEGRLLVMSESAPIERLGPLEEGFTESLASQKKWHVFTLKSGNIWIEVGEEWGFRREIATEVASVLSSPLAIGSLLSLLFVNLIVIYGFRPLSSLATEIAQRQAQDLSRIKLDKPVAELEPVVNALNSLLHKMNEALARERRFTDSAAHELRTPLAALSIHAENLAGAQTEEQREASIANLLTGLSRAKRLVDQMLTYSRISSEGEQELPSTIDLKAELQYLVKNQNLLMEGSGLRIELELPDQTAKVSARLSLLEILIRNLMENACRYTADPSVPVQMSLQSLQSGHWQLTVRNSSRAIEAEDLAKLCEPYFRPVDSPGKGNGLGLAMVWQVVKRHGWQLQLDCKGTPAVFEVTVLFGPEAG